MCARPGHNQRPFAAAGAASWKMHSTYRLSGCSLFKGAFSFWLRRWSQKGPVWDRAVHSALGRGAVGLRPRPCGGPFRVEGAFEEAAASKGDGRTMCKAFCSVCPHRPHRTSLV